ncbi:MAG: phosphatase PAP2 family protein [Bacteroidales bacterium]|nr:phosphatase PAP2 family protein [Bacteroidales bacterium]MBN2819165.1 phosphatase PAP2 family protein [Bacteroidales bacterium]
MKDSFLNRIKAFKPIEVSLIFYLLLTTFILLLFHRTIEHWSLHIFLRLVVFLLIISFIKIRQNNFILALRTFAPFLLLGYFYSETDTFNNLLIHKNLDYKFATIDQIIFGMQPSIAFSATVNSRLISEIMFFGYFAYYFLIIIIPLFIYIKVSQEVGEKISFIILNSFLIYYIVFSFLPVAGPQYYFEGLVTTPKGYLFEPLTRLVQQLGEKPTGAFPSSHVSICLILVWICICYAKELLPYVAPVAIIMIASTVYIGAHYFIDVVAAFALSPVVYLLSLYSYRIILTLSTNLKQEWKYE